MTKRRIERVKPDKKPRKKRIMGIIVPKKQTKTNFKQRKGREKPFFTSFGENQSTWLSHRLGFDTSYTPFHNKYPVLLPPYYTCHISQYMVDSINFFLTKVTLQLSMMYQITIRQHFGTESNGVIHY